MAMTPVVIIRTDKAHCTPPAFLPRLSPQQHSLERPGLLQLHLPSSSQFCFFLCFLDPLYSGVGCVLLKNTHSTPLKKKIPQSVLHDGSQQVAAKLLLLIVPLCDHRDSHQCHERDALLSWQQLPGSVANTGPLFSEWQPDSKVKKEPHISPPCSHPAVTHGPPYLTPCRPRCLPCPPGAPEPAHSRWSFRLHSGPVPQCSGLSAGSAVPSMHAGPRMLHGQASHPGGLGVPATR